MILVRCTVCGVEREVEESPLRDCDTGERVLVDDLDEYSDVWWVYPDGVRAGDCGGHTIERCMSSFRLAEATGAIKLGEPAS